MSFKGALFWLVVVALVAGLGDQADVLGRLLGDDATGPGKERTGQVVRVVDGDTVHVRLGAEEVTVRYIGVDTPETKKPGTPVQCFGKAASAENARLVDGQEVRLELGAEAEDRYGRTLAYVRRARDGLLVNEALLRGGFARTLVIPPNDRYARRFAGVEAQARGVGKGLWGACSG